MPKSKRNRLITLSKVQKQPSREKNERLYTAIREELENHTHAFIFSVDNMRNTFLKDIRAQWEDSRLFFGKTKVMAKALGLTPADEYRDGISKLVPHLHGNVGLFLTSHPPAEIISFFKVYSATDYPRSGAVSPISFTIPAGIIYSDGEADGAARGIEPLAHSLETTIRSLNVPTRLVKGKVTLDQEYVVCREGQVLDSRQTRLLKLFGKEIAEFKIRLIAYWSAADGSVTEIEEEPTEEMKE